MKNNFKSRILQLLCDKLETELQTLLRAAKAAHEAATHEESKAEDQYDTRGLEASYLAGAQAQRTGEVQQSLYVLKNLQLRDFSGKDPIALTALVEVEMETPKGNVRSLHFLVPGGGGLSVLCDERKVQMISPQSPMGDALKGRTLGEVVEVQGRDHSREYEIVSVS